MGDCKHFKPRLQDDPDWCPTCENHQEGRSFGVQYHGGGRMNSREAFHSGSLADAIRAEDEGAKALGRETQSTTRWV